MTVKLFYKSSSEGSDAGLDDLKSDLTTYGAECETIDIDSVGGSAEQELYDVVDFPTVILAGNDGSIIRRWSGHLPQPAEVHYALGNV